MGVALFTDRGTFVVGSRVKDLLAEEHEGVVVAIHSRHPRYAEIMRSLHEDSPKAKVLAEPHLTVKFDQLVELYILPSGDLNLL